MVTNMDNEALNELHAEALATAPETLAAAEELEAAPAAPVIDPAQEWAGVLKIAVMMLTPAMPFMPAIYSDETIAQLAGAIVPVADKYGVTTGGVFGRFGPEIGLAAVAGPLVIRTVQEFRAMRAEQRAAVAAASQPAAPVQAAAAAPQPATIQPE